MIFSRFNILKMTELVKGGQNSKSILANVLDQDDDYISYPPYQGLFIPPYQLSSAMQQQPSYAANGAGYMRVPISPYPDEISTSMQNSISVPAFQTDDSNHIRHLIRNRKSAEVIENPGFHANNVRNAGQSEFACHGSQCGRCIPKPRRTIERKLELGNKELNAILQEIRVITDKVRDEVLLNKYIIIKF